jgi:hypothetical protein
MKAYRVIYADPPWNFKTYSEKGTGRGAVAHYRIPSFETLAAMDVAQYAAKDCALFLWATDPLLPQAHDLIKAWRFEYKTGRRPTGKPTPPPYRRRTSFAALAIGHARTRSYACSPTVANLSV